MQVNQAEYLRSVGEKHRKKYGQFFTRPEVAEFMVQWVLESGQRTLFDPAFGMGAFFRSRFRRSRASRSPEVRKIPKFSISGRAG